MPLLCAAFQSAVRPLWLCAVLTLTAVAATFPARAESPAATSPATSPLGAGATFSTLQVGPVTYHDVRVRSITVRSLVILHRDGLGSIRLRDLSPELQKAFGYSAQAEAAADAAAKTATASAPAKKASPAPPRAPSKFDALLQQFGRPPELRPEVDLRPRFAELGLHAKNQGRRPSCAVFAVVSALEFQNAELVGHPEKLSEEYLIWAVRKLLGRIRPDTDARPDADDEDEGFSLTEVVTALRTYGIPPEERMPDTLGKKMQDIPEPSSALVEAARRHRSVSVYPIPGSDQASVIANLVHALNAGVPVGVGMQWPHANTIRSGYLDAQQPMPDYGHAVTLVGYRCPSQSPDGLVFIFKNSWGVQWGGGGFGQVTYGYLKANLLSSVILEVKIHKTDP